MGVSLEKIRSDAPHLEKTINMVKQVSEQKGIDTDKDRAQVVGTWDFSNSTQDPDGFYGTYNTLYSDGIMEAINELASAVGFTFDDDGQIPYSLFHSHVVDLDNVTPGTSKGFIDRAYSSNSMGGTAYLPALKWIVESVGLGDIDLGSTHRLEVKQQSDIAVYAYFVTDGEPQDDKDAIEEYLRLMSQLPIFVQFIGVGNHGFKFLKKVNNLKGTLLDSCGFFDAKDVLGKTRPGQKVVIDDRMKQKMLKLMLGEFPSYLRKARNLRPMPLITS
jgi:hypothetical protein